MTILIFRSLQVFTIARKNINDKSRAFLAGFGSEKVDERCVRDRHSDGEKLLCRAGQNFASYRRVFEAISSVL